MEPITLDSLSVCDINYLLDGESLRDKDNLPCFQCDKCLIKTDFVRKDEIRFGEFTTRCSTNFGIWCAYCWQRADTNLLDATDGEETHTWTTWQELNDALAKKCRRQMKPAHKE